MVINHRREGYPYDQHNSSDRMTKVDIQLSMHSEPIVR